MQYALLIYSKPGTAEALSADEREANHREYMDIKKLPAVVGGASLHPVETATTVRVQDGQTLVTDGPFADTEEIGRAFLVPAETMKRRLTRAKSKIKVAGIPFGVPAASQLPERLAAVLAVVYLIFNEGYGHANAENGLTAEAIRLGRVVAALLPAEPEVLGLLALMLLHSTRAELLRRLGRTAEARAAYREALTLARTVPERRFLERRIAET